MRQDIALRQLGRTPAPVMTGVEGLMAAAARLRTVGLNDEQIRHALAITMALSIAKDTDDRKAVEAAMGLSASVPAMVAVLTGQPQANIK